MEKKEQVKIKLTTLIILLVIAIIVILTIAIITLNNNGKQLGKNNNVQIGNIGQNIQDTDFNLKFLKIENNKKNIIYSPLSIKYALNMLKDGANGNTKVQIENILVDTNLVKYNNINDVLSFANGVYIRDTYSNYVKNEYRNILQEKYNAEIKYDAFKNADNINSWIENKTFGQIKNMLSDAIVTNPNNEMVLINALAIDMEWEDEFEGTYTHGDTFYLENGNTINATMMNKDTESENISYYKDKNITALAMDLKQYEDVNMQFLAIMPNNNLSEYIEKFSSKDLNNITNNLTLASKTKYGLDISIPRFEFDYNLNLKEVLKNLGMTDAFNEELADFSNMSSKALWVGEALHKANINFSENGIKASAATVIAMPDGAAIYQGKPVEVKINKPFMYFIIDKNTGEIWFVGAVYTPNEWEKDKTEYGY